MADTAEQTEKLLSKENIKDAALFGAEFIPGVGEAMAIKRTSDALDEGDYLGAGIETAAGVMGLIPGVGDVAGKALRTATKQFRPKKTVKAYKLFTKGEDGNLYPLFVDADTPIRQGEFIDAIIPKAAFKAPNGKFYVPSKGTGGKKGTGDNIKIPDDATRQKLIEEGFLPKGSKAKTVKAVAMRPGWHAGDSPAAPHIGKEYKGKKYRSEDQVWAEVEMPADTDWQTIANSKASIVKSGKRKGEINVKEAEITDRLPDSGFYRYKTNPNMQGNWLISGQMKVNRVLDADEVKRLNKEAGAEDLPTLAELKAKEKTPKKEPVKPKTKSPIRKLFDELPKSERDALPAQPDENRIFGYHGTARARKKGEPFFDINFARKNDQFLGEGFYFTLDPKVADEYANLRAFRGFDIIKKGSRGNPTIMRHRETGLTTTTENLMQGKDIEGKPLAMGQNIGRFDLSNLEKPYVVRTEKQRKELKEKIPQLKKEGYDSVLFADFKDRSKQVMVFPESMDKINSDAINYVKGGIVMDDYQFAELEMDKPQKFAEGGMSKQMSMFEDGGLMDEGGTIDPVSGNDVPVGSTQEEVRDDIPAQLSEGEFVFPADVVRYFGLEKLMEMRQEAKAGLQRMEDMGQMGNSEEAILPDDIPFDINDLDMEDEKEYNYQVGGFVPGTAQQQQMGIAGYQAPVMQQTGVAQIPQQQYTPPPVPQAPVPQMQPFARPQQQAVPTMQVPEQLPTFQQAVTPPTGMAPENREYINPETGERRTFTFINNQPTTEIPAGFIPISEYTAAPKTQTPTTAVQTAQVTEESQSDIDRDKAEREAFARIEQRTEMAKRMGYTNFEGFGAGLLNTLGQAFTPMQSSRKAGLVTGAGYISDGKGGLIDPLTGQSIPTNIIRGIIDEFSHIGADSPETKKYLDDVRRRYEASQTDVGRDIQNKLPAIMVEERYKNLVNKINESDASDERKETLLDIAAEVNKEMKANLGKGEPNTKGYVASNVGMDGRIINPFEAMRIAEKDLIEEMSKRGERRVDTSELRASMGRTAQADTIPGGSRPRAEITTRQPTTESTVRTGKTEEEERQDEQAEREAAMSNLGEDTTSGLGGTAAELASSYFEKGGLAAKKKPKPKRMKRGGLASKK